MRNHLPITTEKNFWVEISFQNSYHYPYFQSKNEDIFFSLVLCK